MSKSLKTHIAAILNDHILEVVHVTVLMEDLRPDLARTEVFRVHHTTLDEAVDIAHNADFNFKLAKLGWYG